MTELASEYWENKAEEASRASLSTIQASAAAWATTTSTLLGLFGAVAIVQGPSSIEKLNESDRGTVVVLVTMAAIFAFVSVLATARASRGIPKRFSPLTGIKLAQWHKEETGWARALLRFGRLSGLAAAALVLSAGLVALTASPKPQLVLVRTETGALQCGTLVRDGSQLVLSKGDVELLRLDKGMANVTVVEQCP
ncbi:hypothetical protein [Streptomyces sp. NRRL S-244]|uniref:hypothetical protein n=1 Tax=Streptomyces sp. NRRL S-244 TaxID=1463897 RepID=UPI00131A5724|nr:hypothetical protein [Streptomyces sp. NRRL S-244]